MKKSGVYLYFIYSILSQPKPRLKPRLTASKILSPGRRPSKLLSRLPTACGYPSSAQLSLRLQAKPLTSLIVDLSVDGQVDQALLDKRFNPCSIASEWCWFVDPIFLWRKIRSSWDRRLLLLLLLREEEWRRIRDLWSRSVVRVLSFEGKGCRNFRDRFCA